mgnify:CR=1 FL=1
MFLSFSLVFCFLGGRFGTTLYIYFSGVVFIATRHSSPQRQQQTKTTPKTQRHSSALGWWRVVCICVIFCVGVFGGRFVVVGRVFRRVSSSMIALFTIIKRVFRLQVNGVEGALIWPLGVRR